MLFCYDYCHWWLCYRHDAVSARADKRSFVVVGRLSLAVCACVSSYFDAFEHDVEKEHRAYNKSASAAHLKKSASRGEFLTNKFSKMDSIMKPFFTKSDSKGYVLEIKRCRENNSI